MKHLRKLWAALACAALLLSLATCGAGDNTQPEITGVQDQTIKAGEEFDALAGVTASDAQDGDVTAKIVVEATPELIFKNGKATPEKAGSYELTYSVTDKGGLTAEAYATLTVTKQTGDAVVYKEFDFSAAKPADGHGWTADIGESASAAGELKQGAYVFDIASPGEGDGDIQLVKSGVELKAADYRVVIYAKSTKDTYVHILARDESASEWATFGGAYNVAIGQEIAPIELRFTSPGAGSAELMVNLGKITPNPDNAADTTPEDFTVTIDKIEIFEISGEETRTPAFTGSPELTVSAGDGAAAQANGSAVEISGYPTDGGVWSIKADIALPGIAIEEGQKYYYSFKLNAQAAQGGECLVESASQADANRVHFNGLSANAGEDTEITGVFTAGKAVADPVIRLQLGNPSDRATANTIQISDVEFGKVEGDLETVKTIDAFMAFGKDSANETNTDLPWSTFNGTDEDNERGVGTIWTEGGSFFYRFDQGGTVDWHNKLMCGTNEAPLNLASDSYYTVEITAKADKDVSCGFFLNPLGGWDPRISESMDITTQEQTFSFTTTDTFVTDMNFEMLFQFGSEQTAQLGAVTIEISNVTIYQMPVM